MARPRSRSFFRILLALLVAGAIWSTCLHLVFRKDPSEYRSEQDLSPMARRLSAAHLDVWTNAELRARKLGEMRRMNPEWDFMSRTYFVLALANMSIREPARHEQACEIIDAIIEDTLEKERDADYKHFLLGYGQAGGWAIQPPRTVFVDGEIALMLATRRMIEEKESYRPLLAERVDIMQSRMKQSPVLCAESYPDECWLFCNTIALAAMRMADVLDGTDHSAFLTSWVRTAGEQLIEPETGLLISAFGVDGTPAPSGFRPEGSSIWMACHMLQIVDSAFADEQYRLARQGLRGSILGFEYSCEWPPGEAGGMDIDSGLVLPGLDASAGASGLAVLAAAAFDDEDYLAGLMTSLEFVGLPIERDGRLRYAASNIVGDAVLLYAMTEGPLWDRVRNHTNP